MQQAIDWSTVDSSNVSALAFDQKSQTICVRFANGGLYSYIGANLEIFNDLLHAPSVGKHLNSVVKAFPYTRWESEAELIAHLNV